MHALDDGNHRIRIREKMLEFSSTVLSTLSPINSFSDMAKNHKTSHLPEYEDALWTV